MKPKWLLAAAAALFMNSAAAQEFIEGVHYVELSKPQPVQTEGKYEVREMFWYGCPHCYRLEPYLEEWLEHMPEGAEYVRMPATLNRSWEHDARVFYTFDALQLVDKLHRPYFDALHQERKRIRTAEQLGEWAATFDVDAQSIVDAYNSFAVESKMGHARVMSERYEFRGVPAIILGGKYRTSVGMAGGHNELIALINYVIAKEG